MYHLMGLGIDPIGIPSDINDFKRVASLNTGNLLFNYAAKLIAVLGDLKYSWGSSPELINRVGHGVLIPMANHLGSHVDLSVSGPRIERLSVPIVVLGLGAQFDKEDFEPVSIPEGTRQWLSLVVSRASLPNISLRGNFSSKVLHCLGFPDRGVVLGCPSLLINPDVRLGCRIRRKFMASGSSQKQKHLAIAAGNPFKRHLANLERSLIALVDDHRASYIVQHPRQLICLALSWLDCVEDADFKTLSRWFPGMSRAEIAEWFRAKSKVFVSVPQWILELSTKEFCIGTRIHGVQAAIQAGTPAVCICVDTRTRELCEFMRIPWVDASEVLDGVRVDDLFDVVSEWDWEAFDHNRLQIAANTAKFLEQNAVEVSPHLKTLGAHSFD